MNNDPMQINVPPMVPPQPTTMPRLLPLGDDPADTMPLGGPMGILEALLRHPRRLLYHLRTSGASGVLGGLLILALLCGGVYGLVVGSFSGGTQLWAAPIKVAFGMLLSAAICLPSLYIFACLSGSQAKLIEIVGFVAGLLALTTLLLIGFAPVAWLFSQSTEYVVWMGFLHLAFWFVATLFGLKFLRAGFSHSKARSGLGLAAWMVVFTLVTLQMTTALRPIVGMSDDFLPKEKKFFLAHWGDCVQEASRPEQPKKAQPADVPNERVDGE